MFSINQGDVGVGCIKSDSVWSSQQMAILKKGNYDDTVGIYCSWFSIVWFKRFKWLASLIMLGSEFHPWNGSEVQTCIGSLTSKICSINSTFFLALLLIFLLLNRILVEYIHICILYIYIKCKHISTFFAVATLTHRKPLQGSFRRGGRCVMWPGLAIGLLETGENV